MFYYKYNIYCINGETYSKKEDREEENEPLRKT